MTAMPVTTISKPGIAGGDCGECAGFFRRVMRQAAASGDIDKYVQLEEKKSERGHGKARAYPGKKGSLVRGVVCVVGDHLIFPAQPTLDHGTDEID